MAYTEPVCRNGSEVLPVCPSSSSASSLPHCWTETRMNQPTGRLKSNASSIKDYPNERKNSSASTTCWGAALVNTCYDLKKNWRSCSYFTFFVVYNAINLLINWKIRQNYSRRFLFGTRRWRHLCAVFTSLHNERGRSLLQDFRSGP